MADGRKNNGGARKGAGRKPKADEIALIEQLDASCPSQEIIDVMVAKAKDGDMQAIKLYLNYRFGQPKETVHSTHSFSEDIPWPGFMDESKS